MGRNFPGVSVFFPVSAPVNTALSIAKQTGLLFPTPTEKGHSKARRRTKLFRAVRRRAIFLFNQTEAGVSHCITNSRLTFTAFAIDSVSRPIVWRLKAVSFAFFSSPS